MKKTNTTNPIPPNVAEVLAVFNDQLDKVVFPDVSAETLKKLGEKVDDKVKQVEKAEAALATAQEKLKGSQQDLTALAARALAYAKIYAEDKPALAKQLEGINLRLPKPPKKDGAKAAKPAKDKADKVDKVDKPAKAEVKASGAAVQEQASK